jgi:pimeloyl-ACP methyl ester carboxylesterase
MWKPNLAALARARQVITWDIRGHGRSAAPADRSLYWKRQHRRHSRGARWVRRPARRGRRFVAKKLPVARVSPRPSGARVRVAAFDTGPGFKQDRARERWNAYAVTRAEALEREGLAALSASPEVGAGPHDAAGLALAARGILTQHDSRVLDSLPSIRVPTLIVVGEHDTPFLAATDYMAAKIPGATRCVLVGAGHAANIDQPLAFNAVVSDFLERVDETSDRQQHQPDGASTALMRAVRTRKDRPQLIDVPGVTRGSPRRRPRSIDASWPAPDPRLGEVRGRAQQAVIDVALHAHPSMAASSSARRCQDALEAAASAPVSMLIGAFWDDSSSCDSASSPATSRCSRSTIRRRAMKRSGFGRGAAVPPGAPRAAISPQIAGVRARPVRLRTIVPAFLVWLGVTVLSFCARPTSPRRGHRGVSR